MPITTKRPREAITERPEAIQADSVYPLGQFQRLSGLKEWGLRKATKQGLRVRKCGRNKFVLGKDWIDFLASES